MKDLLHIVLIVTYVVAWIAGAVAHGLFQRRMKLYHAGEWERIHLPGPQHDFRRSMKVQKWIWKREYSSLEDARLTTLGDRANLFFKVFLLLFVLYFVTFFAGVWT